MRAIVSVLGACLLAFASLAHGAIEKELDSVCLVTHNGSAGSGTCFTTMNTVGILTAAHVVSNGTARCQFTQRGYYSEPIVAQVVATNHDIDATLLAIPKSKFGGILPRAIALGEWKDLPKAGTAINTVGCPGGVKPSLKTGEYLKVLGYEQHSGRMLWSPAPEGGRSGSALVSNDGNHILGIICVRMGHEGAGPNCAMIRHAFKDTHFSDATIAYDAEVAEQPVGYFRNRGDSSESPSPTPPNPWPQPLVQQVQPAPAQPAVLPAEDDTGLLNNGTPDGDKQYLIKYRQEAAKQMKDLDRKLDGIADQQKDIAGKLNTQPLQALPPPPVTAPPVPLPPVADEDKPRVGTKLDQKLDDFLHKLPIQGPITKEDEKLLESDSWVKRAVGVEAPIVIQIVLIGLGGLLLYKLYQKLHTDKAANEAALSKIPGVGPGLAAAYDNADTINTAIATKLDAVKDDLKSHLTALATSAPSQGTAPAPAVAGSPAVVIHNGPAPVVGTGN
jgi:hypothetical protein